MALQRQPVDLGRIDVAEEVVGQREPWDVGRELTLEGVVGSLAGCEVARAPPGLEGGIDLRVAQVHRVVAAAAVIGAVEVVGVDELVGPEARRLVVLRAELVGDERALVGELEGDVGAYGRPHLLQQRHQLLGLGAGGDALGREAHGLAVLLEQLLGVGGVVRRVAHALGDVGRLEGEDRVRDDPRPAPHDVDDRLLVDRLGQRFAHPHVVERRPLDVELDVRQAASRGLLNLQACVLGLLHRGRVRGLDQVDAAGLERLQPHVGVGDEPEHDRVEVGQLPAVGVLLPVSRVLDHSDVVARLELAHLEGPRPHRVEREVGTLVLDRRRRRHVADAAGQEGGKDHVRRVELEDDGRRVGRVDRDDVLHVVVAGAVGGRVLQAREVGLHRVRVERRGVLEGHARRQRHRPLREVGVGRERLGEVRHDLAVLVVAHEGVVDA